MYKLEVKLKQHTPLIHFQWEQKGATLRASEVKPKLDRFVLEKLGKEKEGDSKEDCYKRGLDIAKNNGWLIGESKALDYKARIVVNDKPVESLITARYISETSVHGKPKEIEIYSGTSYFAQEKESIGKDPSVLQQNIDNQNSTKTYNFNFDKWNEVDKKGLEWKEIALSITSFYDGLGRSIKGVLREFFICTNFGTRQNKGFGSFEVIEKKEKDGHKAWELSLEEKEEALKKNFQFVYKKKIDAEYSNYLENVFRTIQNDYKLIKSGNNPPNDPDKYKKSKLFLFGVEKMDNEPRWEKRFIKKGIKEHTNLLNNIKLFYNKEPLTGNDKNTNSWEDKPNFYNYKYLRALLGLTEQYEFLTKTKQDKDKVVVKLKNDSVERYKSPLLFKIINGIFYIVGNNSYPVGGKEFEMVFYIKSSKKEKELYVTNKDVKIDKLEIPSDFFLCDFMKFVMTQPEFVECYEDIKNNTKDAKI